MIVIDIGCARYGGDYSLERLIEEFKPRALYGFDPAWETSMFDPPEDLQTTVIAQPAAAWIYDGEVGFVNAGLTSWLTDAPEKPKTPCFDLARFIIELGAKAENGEEIVLKIDAEGSEYELLERLIETRADALLHLIWVEWHCTSCGRGAGGHRPGCADPEANTTRRQQIQERIACELAEWNW